MAAERAPSVETAIQIPGATTVGVLVETPLALAPHSISAPSLRTAADPPEPAEMADQPALEINTGVGRSVVVPSPSWP
jgi:hypothetical protein